MAADWILLKPKLLETGHTNGSLKGIGKSRQRRSTTLQPEPSELINLVLLYALLNPNNKLKDPGNFLFPGSFL